MNAAALWGARPLALVARRENEVWRVALSDGRSAALRLHRVGYHDAPAIQSELW